MNTLDVQLISCGEKNLLFKKKIEKKNYFLHSRRFRRKEGKAFPRADLFGHEDELRERKREEKGKEREKKGKRNVNSGI